MTVYVKDRVMQETRVLSSSATVGLEAVVSGYRGFAESGLVAGNTFPYLIESRALPDWEVGIGTMIDATSFTRTSVTASSNGGAATNFKPGIKYAMIIPSSAEIQTALNPTFADIAGTASNGQLPASPTFTNLIVTSLRINTAAVADTTSTITHHLAININGTVYNLMLAAP